MHDLVPTSSDLVSDEAKTLTSTSSTRPGFSRTRSRTGWSPETNPKTTNPSDEVEPVRSS